MASSVSGDLSVGVGARYGAGDTGSVIGTLVLSTDQVGDEQRIYS